MDSRSTGNGDLDPVEEFTANVRQLVRVCLIPAKDRDVQIHVLATWNVGDGCWHAVVVGFYVFYVNRTQSVSRAADLTNAILCFLCCVLEKEVQQIEAGDAVLDNKLPKFEGQRVIEVKIVCWDQAVWF